MNVPKTPSHVHLKRSSDKNVIPVDSFFEAKVVVVDEGDFAPLNFAQTRPSQLPKIRIMHVQRKLGRVFNAWREGEEVGPV